MPYQAQTSQDKERLAAQAVAMNETKPKSSGIKSAPKPVGALLGGFKKK